MLFWQANSDFNETISENRKNSSRIEYVAFQKTSSSFQKEIDRMT